MWKVSCGRVKRMLHLVFIMCPGFESPTIVSYMTCSESCQSFMFAKFYETVEINQWHIAKTQSLLIEQVREEVPRKKR